MTILEQLADHARKRVMAEMEENSLDTMRELAMSKSSATGDLFAFEQALRKEDVSFICECKKASPSKGLIAPNFPYLEIAKEYEAAGADCISVLTEPKWFLGNDEYLKEIAETVLIPCLRKDFTVDEYQIYQAKVLGASAVLLICSVLTEDQMKDYIRICDELGLSALVEVHDEQEVQTALNTGARIIGVNNRNLKDFSVDTDNSRRLRELIPPGILFVSESGVRTPEDVETLRKIGADAVLIGETLMRASDKRAKLAELRGAV
ncbi:indole-3-glycerol phosphate synthase TrpC [Hominenteromicrobium sp.]|uniref:indole-3-glycerol phosphate synthase TrpC n=1 Tax=Hominenteromicrobium sp. TaxID=3073581 RepID=UPI003A8DD62D